MRIGIEINGVLRDTIGKIEQIYRKNFIDVIQEDLYPQTYTLDMSGNTEMVEKTEPFEYKINEPITSLDLGNHFKFPSNDELYSFLFEEFAMEIFGHAGSVETMTFNDLNEFYLQNRDNHEILIVSDEIGKSKPASLFFLSKFGCLIEKIKFYSNITITTMWDEVDVLVTANPNLINEKPKDKIVIKFNQTYNQNVECEHTIESIKELNNKLQKITENVQSI